MNAQGVKDEEHLRRLFDDPPFVAQEKLDGMRAIVHVAKDGLRLFSRSAGVSDPSRPLEKTSALPHLAALKFPQLIGTILDSEILLQFANSATLSGTVNRKELTRENLLVKIFVFDILRYCQTDLINTVYSDRVMVLEGIGDRISSPFIKVLPIARTSGDK